MTEFTSYRRDEIGLVSEANGSRSRDAITVDATVTGAEPGTVLHKGDDGVYGVPAFHAAVVADPEAEPPVEAADAYWDSADAVLIRNVGAVSDTAPSVAITRAAEIDASALTLPTALAADATFKATAIAELANRKIIVR